jgi:hypothetical protein
MVNVDFANARPIIGISERCLKLCGAAASDGDRNARRNSLDYAAGTGVKTTGVAWGARPSSDTV